MAWDLGTVVDISLTLSGRHRSLFRFFKVSLVTIGSRPDSKAIALSCSKPGEERLLRECALPRV